MAYHLCALQCVLIKALDQNCRTYLFPPRLCVYVRLRFRKSFDASAQFSVPCRILTDQTQLMNNKVKLGWLEYLLELLPSLDSASFKDSTGERLGKQTDTHTLTHHELKIFTSFLSIRVVFFEILFLEKCSILCEL